MKRKHEQEQEQEHGPEESIAERECVEYAEDKQETKIKQQKQEKQQKLEESEKSIKSNSCQQEVCILIWQSTARRYLLTSTNIHQDLISIVLMYAHEFKFFVSRTIKQHDFGRSGADPRADPAADPAPFSIWKPRSICVHDNELIVVDVGSSNSNCLQVFDASTGRFLRHIATTGVFQNGVCNPTCIKAYDNKVFACVSSKNEDYIYIISLLDGHLLQIWNDQHQHNASRYAYFSGGFRICISTDSTEDVMLYVVRNAYDLVTREWAFLLAQISIKNKEWIVLNRIQNISQIISMDIENDSNTLFFVTSGRNQIASVDVKTGQVKLISAGIDIKFQSFSTLVIHGTQIIVGSRESRQVRLAPILQAMVTSFDRDTFSSRCRSKDEDDLLRPSDYGWIQVRDVSDLTINKQTQELFICDDIRNTITVTR